MQADEEEMRTGVFYGILGVRIGIRREVAVKSGRCVLLFMCLALLVGAGHQSFGQGPIIQTYTNSIGTLTFSYPADWAFDNRAVLVLMNDPALLEEYRPFESLAAGQAVIYVTETPYNLNRPDLPLTYV